MEQEGESEQGLVGPVGIDEAEARRIRVRGGRSGRQHEQDGAEQAGQDAQQEGGGRACPGGLHGCRQSRALGSRAVNSATEPPGRAGNRGDEAGGGDEVLGREDGEPEGKRFGEKRRVDARDGSDIAEMSRLGDLDGGGAAQSTVPHHQPAIAGCPDEAIVEGHSALGRPLAHFSGQDGADDEPESPVDPARHTGHHGYHGGGAGIGRAREVDGALYAAVGCGAQRQGMAQHQHEGRLKRKDQQGPVPQPVAPRCGHCF